MFSPSESESNPGTVKSDIRLKDLVILTPGITTPCTCPKFSPTLFWRGTNDASEVADWDDCDWFKDMQTSQSISHSYISMRIGAARSFSGLAMCD